MFIKGVGGVWEQYVSECAEIKIRINYNEMATQGASAQIETSSTSHFRQVLTE